MLLTRLLGGASAAHAELLSYLFFQPQFVGAAIAAGPEDAQQTLAAGEPWRIAPIGGRAQALERTTKRPYGDPWSVLLRNQR